MLPVLLRVIQDSFRNLVVIGFFERHCGQFAVNDAEDGGSRVGQDNRGMSRNDELNISLAD